MNETKSKQKISIVGLGYVGLPTAINFAEKGFNVIGADINQKIVDRINNGESHLMGLNIDERLKKVVENGRLKAVTATAEAVKQSEVIIIAVQTPVTLDKKPDLKYVVSAAEDIARGLDTNKLVVLESTVYPGATEEILIPILERTGLKAGKDFGVAYCPERYNPGDSGHNIENIVRIVAGITPEWGRKTQKLYKEIVKNVVLVENMKTAEAAKIVENIQRGLNIALMNELALIFERLQIDVMDVIKAASTKWNFNLYYPGAGVGGHCLPVNPYYLMKKAEEVGYSPKVITAGKDINEYMPKHIFELLLEQLNELEKSVKNSKIVVLGYSYKENFGDPRVSPSETLVEELKKKKACVYIVDPYIDNDYLEKYGIAEKDIYRALEDADALILMTAHKEFKDIDLIKVKRIMKTPIIIDGRRIFNPLKVEQLGFIYKGVGRGNI